VVLLMVEVYALPCTRISCREKHIIKKVTDGVALTFPEFLDNFYVRYKAAKFRRFYQYLLKYRDQVRFAVYPDFRYDLADVVKCFDVHWIFPLHHTNEIEFVF